MSVFIIIFSYFLKCPFYAFSNNTFHAVCHVAVCEQTFCKFVLPTVHNKVIFYQKKKSLLAIA